MAIELDDIENLCGFSKVEEAKKPTVVGKIVNVLPISKKSRLQLNSVAIYHCVDVAPDGQSSKKFRVLFLADAADKIWSLKLDINDFIAVREVIVFYDHSYSRSDLFYSKILIIRSLPELSKRVLLRIKGGSWISLENENYFDKTSHFRENANVRNEEIEVVSSSNSDNPQKESDNTNANEKTSNDWLVAVKKKRIADNRLDPDDDSTQKLNVIVTSPSIAKSIASSGIKETAAVDTSPSKTSFRKQSPESILHGIVRCYQHHDNNKNKGSSSATLQLSCVLTKLKDVREEAVVNMIVILRDVLQSFVLTSFKKYTSIIRVIDDTITDDFNIRIYVSDLKDLPVFQNYCILFCRKVKIAKQNDKLIGFIGDGRQIISFDKDDSEIFYSPSTDYKLTAEDKKRVDILKNWMFENIPATRPFTPLASLQIKAATVNLRCQIKDLKAFDKNVIILRVSDGTICEIPFYRIHFQCDTWSSALMKSKSYRKPSKEIDIIITAPFDHTFKRLNHSLKVGSKVKLFNVKLTVVSETIKTIPEYSLKAFLDGIPENIVTIQESHENTESDSKKQSEEDDFEIIENTSKKNSAGTTLRSVAKRKLFETSPENTVFNCEEDDFDNDERIVVDSLKRCKNIIRPVNSRVNSRPFSAIDATSSNKDLVLASYSIASTSNDRRHANDGVNDEQPPKSSSVEKSDSIKFVPKFQRETETDNQPDRAANDLVVNAPSTKLVREHLHHSFKSMVVSGKNVHEQRLLIDGRNYITKNSIENYFLKWPSERKNEAFYIQVTIMSTIPVLSESSSDFDTLALISGYCDQCDSFCPFYVSKWFVSDEDGSVGICPKCKEKGTVSILRYELVCDLLLSDEFGESKSSVVVGRHAENFFGFTVAQLCSSAEVKIRVRTFIDHYVFTKGKEKRPLIVKVIPIQCPQSNIYKYHILS